MTIIDRRITVIVAPAPSFRARKPKRGASHVFRKTYAAVGFRDGNANRAKSEAPNSKLATRNGCSDGGVLTEFAVSMALFSQPSTVRTHATGETTGCRSAWADSKWLMTAAMAATVAMIESERNKAMPRECDKSVADEWGDHGMPPSQGAFRLADAAEFPRNSRVANSRVARRQRGTLTRNNAAMCSAATRRGPTRCQTYTLPSAPNRYVHATHVPLS
jgi:hypothetical protein